MTGWPLAFTPAARVQKPMMPVPSGPIQAGSFSLCQPASQKSQATYRRTISQMTAALEFENRNCAIGASWTRTLPFSSVTCLTANISSSLSTIDGGLWTLAPVGAGATSITPTEYGRGPPYLLGRMSRRGRDVVPDRRDRRPGAGRGGGWYSWNMRLGTHVA